MGEICIDEGSALVEGTVFEAPSTFKIKRVLGRGGMGVAVLVEELFKLIGCEAELFSRDVVLKIPIPKNLRDEKKGLADIVREANASIGLANASHIARIEGVNTLRMIDLGLSDNPYSTTPFLKMEYLHRGVLRKFIDIHRELGLLIPPQVNAYILKCIALGCYEAYTGRQMIHRDLCPDNVGFSDDVKILDFGIAVKAGTKDASCIEEFAGKITYASWDQVYGLWYVWNEKCKGRDFEEVLKELDTTQLTVASDIFTIGALGHEIATLEPAFRLEGAVYSNFGLLEKCKDARQHRVLSGQLRKSYFDQMDKVMGVYDGQKIFVENLADILYPGSNPKIGCALSLQNKDCPQHRYQKPDMLAEALDHRVLQDIDRSFSVREFVLYLSVLSQLYDRVGAVLQSTVRMRPDLSDDNLVALKRTCARRLAEGGIFDKDEYRGPLSLLYTSKHRGKGQLRKHPFFFQ